MYVQCVSVLGGVYIHHSFRTEFRGVVLAVFSEVPGALILFAYFPCRAGGERSGEEVRDVL